MEARNPVYTRKVEKLMQDLDRLGWYHSIELPDGRIIQGLQTVEQMQSRLAQFPIPQDLTGKRVLDIGAWDGWFSFEMEKRGAQVMAIDSAKRTRFLVARELLGSKVEYQIADICRVTPKDIGRFDIVLFLGVLYHVKHPMRALETVCDLTTDLACVESYVSDEGENLAAPPVMEFYETTELVGQFDNWVGPNTPCLLAFCRTAGFARVRLESVISRRAHASCFRKWSDAPGSAEAPYVTCVENCVSRDHMFSAAADDYLSFWIETSQEGLTADNVFPQIGAYGSRPVEVHTAGGTGWLVNCKLPPGLDPGWHEARIRVRDSAFSAPIRLAVDLSEEERRSPGPRQAPQFRLHSVTDGRTWEKSRVHVGDDTCISLWAAGLPGGCDRRALTIRLNGSDLPAVWVSNPDGDGLRQVNALLPVGLQPGRARVSVVCDGAESEAAEVELV